MALKPITVARRDYMATICDVTNKSGLPAFVVVDVLEKVLAEIKPAMDAEVKNDFARYKAELAKEAEEGGKENGDDHTGDNG